MTKLRKTEEEFREVMYRVLNPHFHMSLKSRADLLICALDLEFQEPEGRGEGVPEGLSLNAGEEGEATVCRPDGSVWINPCLACGCDDYVDHESVRRLQLLVDTANQMPALLALARELEGELGNHHDIREMGECSGCPTCDLLDRAGKLRRRLEGGRE